MTPKTDRRTQRTQRALLDALTTLMAQKRINRISVKEIADLADVNRSTFYLYYSDVYDMLAKVETEILEDLRTAALALSRTPTRAEVQAFFAFLFHFIEEHAELAKVLLAPEGDSAFIGRIKDAVLEVRIPLVRSPSERYARYFFPFVVTGCVGVIQEWLTEGRTAPPSEMAALMMQLVVD